MSKPFTPECISEYRDMFNRAFSVHAPHLAKVLTGTLDEIERLQRQITELQNELIALKRVPEIDDWKALVRLAYADDGDGVIRICRITSEYNRVRDQVTRLQAANIAEVEKRREAEQRVGHACLWLCRDCLASGVVVAARMGLDVLHRAVSGHSAVGADCPGDKLAIFEPSDWYFAVIQKAEGGA